MAKQSKKRQLKLINLRAASKVKDARKGSKIALLISWLDRPDGATLQQLAKAMSRKGSTVTPSYVKAWMHYDLHKLHGYGVRSVREDNGSVRCFLVRPTVRKRKQATADNVVQLDTALSA